MNTFSNAFRAEVVRMARKELKPELQGMRKALAHHRSEIAALKREVKALASLLKTSKRKVKTVEMPKDVVKATAAKKPGSGSFGPQALLEKRTALGLTQKEMATLLGASSLSIYKWESGQVQPRAAQLVRIAEVLRMGKREARAKLAEARRVGGVGRSWRGERPTSMDVETRKSGDRVSDTRGLLCSAWFS